jgi:hypothetical protein
VLRERSVVYIYENWDPFCEFLKGKIYWNLYQYMFLLNLQWELTVVCKYLFISKILLSSVSCRIPLSVNCGVIDTAGKSSSWFFSSLHCCMMSPFGDYCDKDYFSGNRTERYNTVKVKSVLRHLIPLHFLVICFSSTPLALSLSSQ